MLLRLRHIVLLLGAAFLLAPSLHAQPRDSKGRDFWVPVPPNDHQSAGSGADFVALLFECELPTTIVVNARARNGSVQQQTVQAPGGQVTEIRFDATPYELRGVRTPNGPTNDGEVVSPAGFHVTASQDVTVYAVLREDRTSDAWLVLPTDALGTTYRVSTYASSAVVDTARFGRVDFSQAYPSQLVVMATEDGTDVTIDLSTTRSSVSNGSTRRVRLNRGEAYLVQARVTERQQNDDLTGSRINSTKPIVVLGSHVRAQVPILSEQASRDCLVEQLPSTDTWGKRIIVPPLRSARDAVRSGPRDVPQCRILATEDTTIVTVNGLAPFRLDGGAFRDVDLTAALNVTATKPILVTIIDRSANRSSSARYSGDASLIVVPPAEQFLDAYRVVNVEPSQSGVPVYNQHQITCLVPMVAASSLTVDGLPTPAPTGIPGTTYGYVHIDVSAGTHEVRCDSTFGIIVYGYGPAESYGYTGGMAYERIYRPQLTLRVFDIAGYPGDPDTIVAVVDSIDDVTNLRLSGVNTIVGSVDHDLSVFVVDGAVVSDAVQLRAVHPFTRTFDSINVGDTIAVIVGRHALGQDTAAITTLRDVEWRTGAGSVINVETTVIDGRIRTLGICMDGGTRLFDPRVQRTTREPRYYDVLGRDVGTSIDGLPRGVYFRR